MLNFYIFLLEFKTHTCVIKNNLFNFMLQKSTGIIKEVLIIFMLLVFSDALLIQTKIKFLGR